ncbi:MAG TPA: four helix bundle protein [Chitinophagales bacterium]|nr:four helix bundle protein [Chitinophagales bacterium]
MKHNFRKLKIWEEAVDIVVEVYKSTKKLPREERYGMTSQMRRAANAMPSNIAEGSGKRTEKDFSNFIDISLGSSNELISDLIVCVKLEYLSQTESKELQMRIESWQNMTIKFQENQLRQKIS